MGLLGLTYGHTGRAPKRVTTVAATWTANSAAATRAARGTAGAARSAGGMAAAARSGTAGAAAARSGTAGAAAGVAGAVASQRLMKAPQKASPAPVVSVARAGCAAIGTGASPRAASTQPAAPSF